MQRQTTQSTTSTNKKKKQQSLSGGEKEREGKAERGKKKQLLEIDSLTTSININKEPIRLTGVLLLNKT